MLHGFNFSKLVFWSTLAFTYSNVVSPLLFIVYKNWIDSHSLIDKGVTVGS